jgi:SpoU rRNA methylase family enzyme
MAEKNANWWESYAPAGGQTSSSSRGLVVQPGSPVKEREIEAGIGQKVAGAASSQASAEQTRTLLPAKASKAQSDAELARIKAEAARMSLDKAKALMRNRPVGDDLIQAQNLVLTEIKNAVKARKLSRDMFGASGFGQAITSAPVFSGSPANSVLALLKPIQANTAFTKLQDMRAKSPTGAALGAVSDRELNLLYSTEDAIDPAASDDVFQDGLGTVIKNRLAVANRLGISPEALAEALGPEEIQNFGSDIKAYRFVPDDVKALQAYVAKTKQDGTFDPTDFAALMGSAYYNATGRAPDETFVKNALDTGMNLQTGEGAGLSDFSYEQADKDVQKMLGVQANAGGKTELGIGEVLGGAALNFIPSAFELAYDTAKALTVDLPDTLESLVKVVGGATGLTDDTQYEALKKYYTDRYGSIEGFKQALMTDPASIAADVAGLATGGATILAKTAGLAAKVGKIGGLSNAAKAAEGFSRVAEGFATGASKLDPMRVVGATTKLGAKTLGNVAEQLVVNAPARMVGATGADVKQAFSAGKRGSKEFIEQATETGDVLDPLAKADKALTELYQNRSTEYQRRMQKLKQNPETLAFDDVEKAIEGVRDVGRHKGIDISGAGSVWDEIDAKYMEFFNKGLNSIEDFDAMKRAIKEIGSRYQVGTPEFKVANDVAKSINATITAKAPNYAKIMGDYRLASDTLSDVKASIASGAKSADTTLSKLMRSASGKGPRGRSVIQLLESTQSGKGLGDMLAGRNLSSTEPSGLAPSMMTTGAAASGSPEMLVASALSPRGLGMKAYELGQKYGTAERGIGAAGRMVGADQFVPKAVDLVNQYLPSAKRGVFGMQPIIQSQEDPFALATVSPEDRQRAIMARYAATTTPQATLVERTPLSLDQYRVGLPSGGNADLAELLKMYTGDNEQPAEEEQPGFARGGLVMAPSMF